MSGGFVKVKRLPNCFGPSERYLKRFSLIEHLISQLPKDTHGLSQFDELPAYDSDILFIPASNDTISDYLLDKVISEKNISIINAKFFTNFKEIKIPARATEGSAGFDLQAAVEETVFIAPGEFKLIPTGLSISMPNDLELQVRPRSGLAAKHGVTVLNAPGTVDSDYGGEIKVILINHGKESFAINRGDRIAQAVFNNIAIPTLTEVDGLEETTRGSGGFGSTGVK